MNSASTGKQNIVPQVSQKNANGFEALNSSSTARCGTQHAFPVTLQYPVLPLCNFQTTDSNLRRYNDQEHDCDDW